MRIAAALREASLQSLPAAVRESVGALSGSSAVDRLTTGVYEFDQLCGGLPQGTITELRGARTSGHTSLLTSLLAGLTNAGQNCAVIDAGNSFDPTTAMASGVVFQRMLWVRCGGEVDRAFRATDLLVQAGGFGVVMLDMKDVPARHLHNVPPSTWHRLRLAVKGKLTALVVLSGGALSESCSALRLEARCRAVHWLGAPQGWRLLDGLECDLLSLRPHRPQAARLRFTAA